MYVYIYIWGNISSCNDFDLKSDIPTIQETLRETHLQICRAGKSLDCIQLHYTCQKGSIKESSKGMIFKKYVFKEQVHTTK